ncbi:Cof-type HAD-IIB family hydrolase [Anaerobacillus alkalidiazotrophicus]|uniref:Cof-type HAD-IIB family hydrolase n=1 Tax=Anaerobacillus alkalidiazotrophicus TaxID=472963 RepID=UPI000A052D85|nr:Cof-type HAD-IIB family hydrolase [Anaerobacillus alkalidiazotrophicus]
MKLIATDMDGTLVDHMRELPGENAKAILAAQEGGILVVVATGRDYTEAIKPLKEAGIRCPIICVNGAEIRSEEGEIIDSTPLSTKQFREIETILGSLDIYYEIYTTKGAFTKDRKQALQVVIDVIESTGFDASEKEALQIAERRFQQGEITYVESFDNLVEDQNVEILKVLAFTKDEKARLDGKNKLENPFYELSISSSASDNLEISSRNAQKGIALKMFAENKGISMEEVMAIGDNFNDVSMLKAAGISVAMGNAEPEIKDICSYITKTNDENGVAFAINKFLKETVGK